MKNLKSIISLAGFTIILSACSSPKDASKENFEKIINTYLAKNCILVSPSTALGNGEFPVMIELPTNDRRNPEKIKSFEVFVSIGFLEVKDGTIKRPLYAMSDENVTVPTKVYSLTIEGKKLYQEEGTYGFCVATKKVTEINNYSKPSQEIMGQTVSNVSYKVSATKVNDWAKKKNFKEAFPNVASKLEETQSESTMLVLMNDGWVHENEAKF